FSTSRTSVLHFLVPSSSSHFALARARQRNARARRQHVRDERPPCPCAFVIHHHRRRFRGHRRSRRLLGIANPACRLLRSRRQRSLCHHRFLMERQHRALQRVHGIGRRHFAERHSQPLDGARVQLRHARFVHANLGANLLHRHVAVVIKANHFTLARRQR